MQIEYRLGRMEDLSGICRLVHNAVNKLIENNIFQWDEIYPAEADFREDINKKELYVGIVDGNIAVTYTINQEYDDEYEKGEWKYKNVPYCVVHRLCVAPEFQNRGIGRQTLLHIEEQVLSNKVKAIRLDAFTQNPYSLKMYNKLGYSFAGYVHFRKGEFCLLEKSLGG